MRRDIWEVLQLIRTDEKPPIKGMPKPDARVARWVQPRLLAEVEYTEITPDGLIRHPSFKGLREDKDAREAHIEESLDA
jgi:ATP-dependent DNA ligase